MTTDRMASMGSMAGALLVFVVAACATSQERGSAPVSVTPSSGVDASAEAGAARPRTLFAGGASQPASCLVENGAARCWGAGSPRPRTVENLESVAAVAPGGAFEGLGGCAVASGAVFCWNLAGGYLPSQPLPKKVPGSDGAVAVALWEGHHACMLVAGRVACIGMNQVGQAGTGTLGDTPVVDASPAVGVDDVVDVTTAFDATCAARSDGTVWCWGSNPVNTTGKPTTAEPGRIAGIRDVKAVSGTHSTICGLRTAGDVWCWGRNDYGTLGRGSKGGVVVEEPGPVVGLDDVVALSAGQQHFCALRSSGEVACWGYNGHHQLGDGSRDDAATPVTVKGLAVGRVVELAAGSNHTCARGDTGVVQCWGDNEAGQLGAASEERCEFGVAPDAITRACSARPLTVTGL